MVLVGVGAALVEWVVEGLVVVVKLGRVIGVGQRGWVPLVNGVGYFGGSVEDESPSVESCRRV